MTAFDPLKTPNPPLVDHDTREITTDIGTIFSNIDLRDVVAAMVFAQRVAASGDARVQSVDSLAASSFYVAERFLVVRDESEPRYQAVKK